MYDPKIISDEKMYQWGLEAMKKGEIEIINGNKYFKGEFNGLDFIGYLDEATNEIKNFHPVLPEEIK